MLAVDEKADMESISRGAATYKVIEEIRDYSQLGGLKKEQDRLQQQIFVSNMIMTTRQHALLSLMRLQALGVTDMEIKNMAQLMDFGSILEKKGITMAIQTTAGRHSEYTVTITIPVPVVEQAVRPPVVCKQIRIGMPRSLLKSLKILAKSKRIGVTEIILDVFREYLYAYRNGLGQQQQKQQQLQQKQQPPQPFNNQYYPVDILGISGLYTMEWD